jgi:hypothetical protein
MPIDIRTTAGGQNYASPFIGRIHHVRHIKLDLSTLTIDTGAEVDSDGYLRPGTILKEAAGLAIPIGAAAGVPLVVIEAIKLPLATIPPTNASLAAATNDPLIAVATHGLLNRDIQEDNLGRAMTANEIASFVTAGSNIALTNT